MLKRDIKYTDFNDNEVTETFYFNLTMPELIEAASDPGSDLAQKLQKMVDTKNVRDIIIQIKDIILMAYGERSEDGKRFIKNEELREGFSQSAAYHKLFMELAFDDKAAGDFILGVLPKDMPDEIKKLMTDSGSQNLATVPPPTT